MIVYLLSMGNQKLDAEGTPLVDNTLLKMRALLAELDAQSNTAAAAYLAQAISVLEDQAAPSRGCRV